jgi:hypothetical protein
MDIDTVLAYASCDTLAGLIADCKRQIEWDDSAEAAAIAERAMAALVDMATAEEAARLVAEKVALG